MIDIRPRDYWCNDEEQMKHIEAALDFYEGDALAVLRELNDICWGVIPSDLQERLDALLDRADEQSPWRA